MFAVRAEQRYQAALFVKVVALIRVACVGALTIMGNESPASVRTPRITHPKGKDYYNLILLVAPAT
jgi:hypothetical protein